MEILTTSPSKTAIQKHFESNNGCYFPKRFIVMILAFFGVFSAYTMRGNISVVIVAMVNTSYHNAGNSSQFSSGQHDGNSDAERYSWDAKTQSVIMGAFFYSYFLTTLTGGYLSARFGAKNIFGGGMLCTSVLNLLTPVFVRWGYVPLIINRTLLGLSEGSLWPSVVGMLGHWVPQTERSRIFATVFNGSSIGLVFSFAVSGWMSSVNFFGGWPSVFYTFGAFGCFWCIIWFTLTSQTPHTHPSIREDELALFADAQRETSALKIPWLKFLTSVPFWAVVSSNFGMFMCSNLIILELPTYLNNILHFQVLASGFLSTVPYILQVCGGWVSSYAADKLRNSNTLHITTIRKLMDSIGGYGFSACLVGIALAGYRPYWIIVLFCVGEFVNGFKESGFCVTFVDMSPDFCGIIFGISNGISSISGIIGPTMAGAFTQNGATISNWGKVFCVAAAVQASTTTIFALFASAELQPWGRVQDVNQTEDRKRNVNKNLNAETCMVSTK